MHSCSTSQASVAVLLLAVPQAPAIKPSDKPVKRQRRSANALAASAHETVLASFLLPAPQAAVVDPNSSSSSSSSNDTPAALAPEVRPANLSQLKLLMRIA
jgi:hypothetical protein